MRGTLFLLVGPSGAGKDTLIDGARQTLAADKRFVFARRVITRPESAGGEDHEEVSQGEFERRIMHGQFLLHWTAHGLGYALLDPMSGRTSVAGSTSTPKRRFIQAAAASRKAASPDW